MAEKLRGRLGPQEWREYLKLDELRNKARAIVEHEIYVQAFGDAVAPALAIANLESPTLYAMLKEAEGRAPDQSTAPFDR